jgi:hypothetical protein
MHGFLWDLGGVALHSGLGVVLCVSCMAKVWACHDAMMTVYMSMRCQFLGYGCEVVSEGEEQSRG